MMAKKKNPKDKATKKPAAKKAGSAAKEPAKTAKVKKAKSAAKKTPKAPARRPAGRFRAAIAPLSGGANPLAAPTSNDEIAHDAIAGCKGDELFGKDDSLSLLHVTPSCVRESIRQRTGKTVMATGSSTQRTLAAQL